MSERIKLKLGTIATSGFVAAFNKLTSYPQASFNDTYALSKSKRDVLAHLREFQDTAEAISSKFGTVNADGSFTIPNAKVGDYKAEMKLLGDKEVDIYLDRKIKIISKELPAKYFTADDLFFLEEQIIEIIQ